MWPFLIPACVACSDELALQTFVNDDGLLGYVTAREADREVFCDFMDAATEEKQNPPRPRMCRFVLVRLGRTSLPRLPSCAPVCARRATLTLGDVWTTGHCRCSVRRTNTVPQNACRSGASVQGTMTTKSLSCR